jgi:hypothetical protein
VQDRKRFTKCREYPGAQDGRGADEIFPGPYLRFARAMPLRGIAGLRYGGTWENLQRSGGKTWKGIFRF